MEDKLYQIAMAQIDPNGLCNSGCWFCPVAYSPNPEFAKKTMSLELLDSICKQLHEGKGDFVTPNFDFIYTAHYNEVLLYKHFEEMLQIFRKYNFKTMVLSNGIPLTNQKVDIIKQYPDVVYGICLNIPSSEPELWAQYTKFNVKMFDRLMGQIQYAMDELPEYVTSNRLTIQVNGVNENSLFHKGGWLIMKEGAPSIDMNPLSGTLANQVKGFQDRFPGLQVYDNPYLVDRAGTLADMGIISNGLGIQRDANALELLEIPSTKKVIGCKNGREVGGRAKGWIHVNANGHMFICCNDYEMQTIYGNLEEKPLKEIWNSEEHLSMVQQAYDTLCITCGAAIWSE